MERDRVMGSRSLSDSRRGSSGRSWFLAVSFKMKRQFRGMEKGRNGVIRGQIARFLCRRTSIRNSHSRTRSNSKIRFITLINMREKSDSWSGTWLLPITVMWWMWGVRVGGSLISRGCLNRRWWIWGSFWGFIRILGFRPCWRSAKLLMCSKKRRWIICGLMLISLWGYVRSWWGWNMCKKTGSWWWWKMKINWHKEPRLFWDCLTRRRWDDT